MKSIQKYSGYVMIFVVIVCALSLFWYVQNSSPSSSSSTESFADNNRVGEMDVFKFKNPNGTPGEPDEKFRIKENKLYRIIDGNDEPMEKMYTFELSDSGKQITGTRTFGIKKA